MDHSTLPYPSSHLLKRKLGCGKGKIPQCSHAPWMITVCAGVQELPQGPWLDTKRKGPARPSPSASGDSVVSLSADSRTGSLPWCL